MSLRVKLFLIFGGLVSILILAQWLMVRSLTDAILKEFGIMAVNVGRDMVSIMHAEVLEESAEPGGERKPKRHRKYVYTELETERGGRVEEERVVEKADETRDSGKDANETKGNRKPSVDPESDTAEPVLLRTHLSLEALERGMPGRQIENIDIRLQPTKSGAEYLIFETMGNLTKIPLPTLGLAKALGRLSGYWLLGTLLILALGLVSVGFLAYRIAKPLAALAAAAREVGGGALGIVVAEPAGPPEISQAVKAFNAMSVRLDEMDRQAARHRRQKYLSELGEVARGLAHTIRNPLNTLGLSLEQMAALSGGREEAENLVLSSRRQIRRIDRWIRSFLALASEGKGNRELLDFGALVQDVVLEALQDQPGKVGIHVDLAADLPKFRGIAAELRAVVQALVVNAVEAGPANSKVLVRAEPGREPGSVRLEVLDQGPGIDPTVRERLFTPHVTTKPQGSGMGLFLAYRIATDRYGGELRLLDAEPHGVRAVLVLREESGDDVDPNPGG